MSNKNIPKNLNEVIEQSKNIDETEAYKLAHNINQESKDLHATVKEGKVEAKQILRG